MAPITTSLPVTRFPREDEFAAAGAVVEEDEAGVELSVTGSAPLVEIAADDLFLSPLSPPFPTNAFRDLLEGFPLEV